MGILLMLIVIVLPKPAASQADVPEYDFWDDSVFDDIVKTSYDSHERDILYNITVDDCVEACLQNDTCVSLFYHPGRLECERVPTNVLMNAAVDDSTIRTCVDNRYFRYLPPGPEFCPMERCFYYDRKARACWKVLLWKGPRYAGRYTYGDAQRGCESEGAQMVSLDTLDKLTQLSRLLINIPDLLPKPTCRWMYVGGRRSGGVGSPYVWKNGQQASTDPGFWRDLYSRISRPAKANCLVLVGFKSHGAKMCNSFKLMGSDCNALRPGVVCELPVPAEISAAQNAQQPPSRK